MQHFNKLFKQLIENNTSAGVMGMTAPGTVYAAGDNRPIEPAKITIGAKTVKRKNKNEPLQQMVKIPVQKRPKIENVVLKNK